MPFLEGTWDKNAPLKESRERKMAKIAWFTKGLEKVISKRNLADKERRRTGKEESLCKFKELRKRVQSGVRLIKSEYFRRQFENCVGESKQTYTFLNLMREIRKTSAQ